MKIHLICSECFRSVDKTEDLYDSLVSVVVRQDGRYEATCPKGHTFVATLQQQDFEVLFEIGAHAFLDGYFREAVSSFTASMERFFEFYIRVATLKHGYPMKLFNSAWSQVSEQSERQLGAFVFVYTLENGAPPDVLGNQERKFRNDVIHKGMIPTSDEVVTYGNRILQIIRPVLRQLKSSYNEFVQETVRDHLGRIQRAGEGLTTMCVPTILSITVAEEEAVDKLEEALHKLKRFRDAFDALDTYEADSR